MKNYVVGGIVGLMLLISNRAMARLDNDPGLRTAIENILHERYKVAEHQLDSLIQVYPADPAPVFFKGVLYWRKSVFLDDRNAYEKQGIVWWDKTLDICDKQLELYPDDAYLLFYKGGTHGLVGTIYAKNFKFFKAGIQAIKGIRNLEDAYEADSTFGDTYFGLGLYHMTAANSPGIVKFLQRLLPIPNGDEEKAYQYLKISIKKGQFAPFMARATLAFSYNYYKCQHDSAYAYLAPILKEYPENTSALVFATNIFFHRGILTGITDWDSLAVLIDRLEHRMDERGEQLEIYYRDKILLEKGVVAFHQKRNTEAGRFLEQYISQYDDSDFAGVAYLTLGALYDLQGDRPLALQLYKQARKKKQLGIMKDWLETRLKEPYNSPQRVILIGDIFDLPDRP
ncbi:tetratricopeptide repeat protein [candidate division KSB1 bacterium]|nr:tetratricopeptide repeat protein [candidate division KSB1 bacterium]